MRIRYSDWLVLAPHRPFIYTNLWGMMKAFDQQQDVVFQTRITINKNWELDTHPYPKLVIDIASYMQRATVIGTCSTGTLAAILQFISFSWLVDCSKQRKEEREKRKRKIKLVIHNSAGWPIIFLIMKINMSSHFTDLQKK